MLLPGAGDFVRYDGTFLYWILLIAATLGAGAANALAGGGMFLIFPALLFAGVAPVTANATATLILIPGGWASTWVYRDTLKHGWRLQGLMAGVSVIGALGGSELLLHTPPGSFAKLVPYLMLTAALIFSFAGKIKQAAQSHASTTIHYVPLVGGQFLLAIYGGYFGAGMGVLMLALYLITAHIDMQEASGMRLICGTASNIVAAIVFAIRGIIDWHIALPRILACVAGGYWGAQLVKRLDPEKARRAILIYAWGVTLWLLVRSFLS
jgi:uncharacterized membrane protein YfcA